MQIFIILFLPFEGFGRRIEGTWLDGLSQTSVKLDNCRKQRHVLASWLMAKQRVAGCLRGNFGTLKPKSKSQRSQKVK